MTMNELERLRKEREADWAKYQHDMWVIDMLFLGLGAILAGVSLALIVFTIFL